MSELAEIILLMMVGTVLAALWAPWFIGKLYQVGLRRQDEKHRPIYRYLQQEKTGVPSMGGVLVLVTLMVSVFLFLPITPGMVSILLSMILFGVLGGIDDLKTLMFVASKYWGLRRRHILLVQTLIGLTIGSFLYYFVGLNSLSIPATSLVIPLGILMIPYSAFLIVATSNSFNITDGIDGLSSGLLIIALLAFLVIALATGSGDIARLIALWIGILFVYLYFNITPARFMMGDVGAQPFGAMLAVVALLLHLSLLLPIIGGMFFIEGASSLIQMLSRRYRHGKKVFTIAPLHYHFQVKRWSEGKICMRFWLFGGFFALMGLFLAFV